MLAPPRPPPPALLPSPSHPWKQPEPALNSLPAPHPLATSATHRIPTLTQAVLQARFHKIARLNRHSSTHPPSRSLPFVTQAENYGVDVGGPFRALLPVLAFEGATKRNRPSLQPGDLVYCRVETAHRDLEAQLSCMDAAGKVRAGAVSWCCGRGWCCCSWGWGCVLRLWLWPGQCAAPGAGAGLAAACVHACKNLYLLHVCLPACLPAERRPPPCVCPPLLLRGRPQDLHT